MKPEPIEARYLPQVIEEYKGNPLIEALPPIYAGYEVSKLLTVDPGYNEGEREFDQRYRFHCISRLFRYFQPLETHIDIEQRVSRAIRQGYVSKSPVTPDYASTLAQGSQAIREKNIAAYSMNSTASGFTIIGMSGVGKTTAMDKVLSLYPQQILHTQYKGEPLFFTQLLWAKIDCPFDGSLKGLCLSFFAYVDRVMGTTYSKKFSADRMTVDAALPRMAQIATTHCLGLLVIDEIQHLSMAKSGGSEKMLNFFVTLVNTIGVPVVLIGTTKAMSVLQSEFRQARRGSGQGDLLWDRMQNDLSWEIMLRAMWKNQWTRHRTPLTAELKDVLYDESQGIIDIAVKLYAMAQMKAIADGTEVITPETIREVAAEKLRLVRPMLNALRSGDRKKLFMYEDIKPISVEDYLAAQAGRIAGDAPLGRDEILSLEEQAILKLLEMDIPAKAARSAVKKAIGKSVSAQPLAAVVKKAFKIALNMETSVNPSEPDEQGDDLRKAAGYENLKELGFVTETADEF